MAMIDVTASNTAALQRAASDLAEVLPQIVALAVAQAVKDGADRAEAERVIGAAARAMLPPIEPDRDRLLGVIARECATIDDETWDRLPQWQRDGYHVGAMEILDALGDAGMVVVLRGSQQ